MHTTCFVSVIKSKWNAPVRSSTIFIIETERRARDCIPRGNETLPNEVDRSGNHLTTIHRFVVAKLIISRQRETLTLAVNVKNLDVFIGYSLLYFFKFDFS